MTLFYKSHFFIGKIKNKEDKNQNYGNKIAIQGQILQKRNNLFYSFNKVLALNINIYTNL